MIIAVITALSVMQAAGGLDYLVTPAERMMWRHRTTHVIYALLPLMAEVAHRHRVDGYSRHPTSTAWPLGSAFPGDPPNWRSCKAGMDDRR